MGEGSEYVYSNDDRKGAFVSGLKYLINAW